MATLSGTVRDTSYNLVARVVRVYRQDTGAFVGQTLSNATTGAWSVTTADTSKHFALVHDTDQLNTAWANTLLAMHLDDAGLTDSKGRTVTISGAVRSTAVNDPFGNATGVAYFDGSNDYLSVPHSTDFRFGTGNFTVEAWIRPASVSGVQRIVGKAGGNSFAGVNQWELEMENADIGFHLYVGGQYRGASSFKSGLVANTWQHVAGVRNGQYTTVYLNGVPGTPHDTYGAPVSMYASETEDVRLGEVRLNGQRFSGYMAEVQVYNYAKYTADFSASLPSAKFVNGVGATTENAQIFDNLTPI